MYPQHPCLICGTLTTNRLVCSKQCTGKLKSQRALIHCPVCNQLFKPKRNKSNRTLVRCCSRKCAGILRQKRSSYTCLMCGHEITEKVSHSRKFCSKKCHDSWLPSQRPIHTCRNCGKQFTSTRGHKQKPLYCSHTCRDAYRKMLAPKHICQVCHKEFTSKNSHPKFCSRACLNLYKGPTSIEDSIAGILSDLEVDFIPQYQLREFVFDFLVSSSQLLIECDGTYWHSSREAKNRDKLKDQLAKQNGFRVLRLPQVLITQQPEQCRNTIVKELT